MECGLQAGAASVAVQHVATMQHGANSEPRKGATRLKGGAQPNIQ